MTTLDHMPAYHAGQSAPVPLTALAGTDGRWARGGGVSSRARCAERGCPYPPDRDSPGGRCRDHEREQPAPGSGGYYRPTVGGVPIVIPAGPTMAEFAELAVCWLAERCEIDPALPFAAAVGLASSWRAYARHAASYLPGDAPCAPMRAALLAAGAQPATSPCGAGYTGVRLVQPAA